MQFMDVHWRHYTGNLSTSTCICMCTCTFQCSCSILSDWKSSKLNELSLSIQKMSTWSLWGGKKVSLPPHKYKHELRFSFFHRGNFFFAFHFIFYVRIVGKKYFWLSRKIRKNWGENFAFLGQTWLLVFLAVELVLFWGNSEIVI